MKIINHFLDIKLTQDQRNTVDLLESFFNGGDKVFILQGYAGSGKTTLIKGIISYLKEIGKTFEVMAPTGRAAKILRDKTGCGQTIHKSIYNYKELQTLENNDCEDDKSFRYIFPIRENQNDGSIIIVDEASMISAVESTNEVFSFGTEIVLNDLLTYSRIPFSKNKIIFVGDPAQLPPVGDSNSKALIKEYFEELGIKTSCSALTQVVRQQHNNILKNATEVRRLIGVERKSGLKFHYDDSCFFKINSEDIASNFSEKFPIPKIGQGVIITYSNSQCLQYNRSVRKRLFPESNSVSTGDILIIIHNNYHSFEVELMNGEMVQVVSVSKELIQKYNIPVYTTINGQRVKKYVNLSFREVIIRTENHPSDIECYIIDSLLNSPNRDLTILEMKALYIDFVMRFQDEQKNKKENGICASKVGDDEFFDQLKTDKFFNALRVKYGYAMTCHKAQGGEWNTTFVDYFGRTTLKDDPLRWVYTATTRAIEKCYAANAPYVSELSEFKIGEIQPLSNIPGNALYLNEIPVSPYHSEVSHIAKSLKYWEISEKLENSKYQISDVITLGPYHERYKISFNDEKDEFDVHHNEAGIFNEFKAVHKNNYTWHQEILEILNKPHNINYNINYTPSLPGLELLYGYMQSICAEIEIQITNIEEHCANYYVYYFLKTDSKCSLIQFYFNKDGKLTRALPKSTSHFDDYKLITLISKLHSHVI